MNKFLLVALRIRQDKCSLCYRKVLKDDWYLFHKKYKIENNELVENEGYLLPHDFFSDKINLHAIVGKNGSGKSSLIDLILQLINNLSCRLLGFHSDTSGLSFVSGIYADLYYQIGTDHYRIECSGEDVLLYKNAQPVRVKGKDLDIAPDPKESALPLKIEKKDAFELLQTFFFTILSNYSLHSYNFSEQGEDNYENEWLRGVFHKNDGYLVPISINPFRSDGKWDILKETHLSNTRLALLFYQFKKEGIDFIDGYVYEKTEFRFNSEFINEKYRTVDPKTSRKSQKPKEVSINHTRSDIFNYTLKCYFEDPLPDSSYILDACRYLVAKTYQISARYPNYKKDIKKEVIDFSKYCRDQGGERKKVKALVDKIKNDHSHVTIKIKQTNYKMSKQLYKPLSAMSKEELWQLFPIILSDHQSKWKDDFEVERKNIESNVDSILKINHIGSTAIPGLLAKPTIDILVEVSENTNKEKLIQQMESIGYIYEPQPDNPAPHMMFMKGYTPQGFKPPVYHIHVRYSSDWDEIRFRDYLIAHPEAAKEYGELKLALKDKFEYNRDGYTDAKTEFIQKIMNLAKPEQK